MLEDLLADAQRLLLPLLAGVALFSAPLVLLSRAAVRRGRDGAPPVAGAATLIIAFGLLGGVAGLLTGNSRQPIAGPLLTGLLGLIGGLLSYLFSKEPAGEHRAHIPFLLVALVLNTVAGLSVGSSYRKSFEEAAFRRELWKLCHERVELEVRKARALQALEPARAVAAAAAPAPAAPLCP